MLRWALAYEMRSDDLLLIAPCVPWHWVAEYPLEVSDLPTRWGYADYSIESLNDRVFVSLELAEDFPASLRVRVPTPEGAPLRSVKVNDRGHKDFHAKLRLVELQGLDGEISIEATFDT